MLGSSSGQGRNRVPKNSNTAAASNVVEQAASKTAFPNFKVRTLEELRADKRAKEQERANTVGVPIATAITAVASKSRPAKAAAPAKDAAAKVSNPAGAKARSARNPAAAKHAAALKPDREVAAKKNATEEEPAAKEAAAKVSNPAAATAKSATKPAPAKHAAAVNQAVAKPAAAATAAKPVEATAKVTAANVSTAAVATANMATRPPTTPHADATNPAVATLAASVTAGPVVATKSVPAGNASVAKATIRATESIGGDTAKAAATAQVAAAKVSTSVTATINSATTPPATVDILPKALQPTSLLQRTGGTTKGQKIWKPEELMSNKDSPLGREVDLHKVVSYENFSQLSHDEQQPLLKYLPPVDRTPKALPASLRSPNMSAETRAFQQMLKKGAFDPRTAGRIQARVKKQEAKQEEAKQKATADYNEELAVFQRTIGAKQASKPEPEPHTQVHLPLPLSPLPSPALCLATNKTIATATDTAANGNCDRQQQYGVCCCGLSTRHKAVGGGQRLCLWTLHLCERVQRHQMCNVRHPVPHPVG